MGEEHSPYYMWKIPEGIHRDGARCVLRLRYNITTKDFPGDSWNVFANSNGQNSPVRNNPINDFVGLGLNVSGPIRLNINTAQVGRTFQDRSHVFLIRKRPENLRCGLRTSSNCKILNLNVRGRRGNIQQTYPAVEYDFVPPVATVSRNDYLHIQWTGSDANDQNNAGNGRTGTDRSNIVLISNLGRNYPISFSPLLQNRPNHFSNNLTLIAHLAFLNQTGCNDAQTNTNANDNCRTLNRAPAYIDVGLVQMENPGVFHYMSTRNNAFSNRDQKATIIVEEDNVTIGAGVGIGITGVVLLSLGSLFTLRYAKRNPESKLGAMYKVVKSNEVLADDPTAASSPGQESDNELDVDEKKNLVDKHPWLASFVEWYAWHQPRILFWTFFVSCQSAAWLYGYFLNRHNPSPFFGFAKGFGKMLDFSMGFILLPILRNFLSYLRTTPAGDKLPLDDNIRMHKWTGYTIVFASLGHISMHFCNYYWAQTNFATPIYISLFTNLPGVTGVLVTLVMLCMYSTAFLKRKIYSIFGNRFDGYRTFLQLHRLWIPVYAILFIHGAQFWQWAIFPLIFISIEKYIQSRRVKQDVKIIEAKLVGRDVLALKMQLLNGRKKFRYKAGQYLFLCCPDINESEFHPFTITSAPEESFFSCHIRCRPDMDWTYALRKHVLESAKPEPDTLQKDADVINMEVRGSHSASSSNLASPSSPTSPAVEYDGIVLRIDGPYGSASEEVFDFDTVILVGAGIGVTPFISILKSISMRLNHSESAISIYFYWICRDQQEFDSFKDFFDQIVRIKELQGVVELNMYVTGELNLKNVKAEAYNQYSGRPNWNRIFKEMAKRHQGSEIGVFLCGPAALAPELANASKKHSTKRSKALMKGKQNIRTIFKFHKENF
jgi:NADPH oxidase